MIISDNKKNPIKLYHVENYNNPAHLSIKIGSNDFNFNNIPIERGRFFTDSKALIQHYLNDFNDSVAKPLFCTYADVKNPIIVDAKGSSYKRISLRKTIPIINKIFNKNDVLSTDAMASKIYYYNLNAEKKFDSLIILNVLEEDQLDSKNSIPIVDIVIFDSRCILNLQKTKLNEHYNYEKSKIYIPKLKPFIF